MSKFGYRRGMEVGAPKHVIKYELGRTVITVMDFGLELGRAGPDSGSQTLSLSFRTSPGRDGSAGPDGTVQNVQPITLL